MKKLLCFISLSISILTLGYSLNPPTDKYANYIEKGMYAGLVGDGTSEWCVFSESEYDYLKNLVKNKECSYWVISSDDGYYENAMPKVERQKEREKALEKVIRTQRHLNKNTLSLELEKVKQSADRLIRKEEFQQAINNKDTKQIKKLIQKSKSFENIDALVLTALSADKSIVQLFLDYGIDINAIDYSGQTPLSMVCGNSNYEEMVSFLLKQGADANAARGEALYNASRQKNKAYVNLLLANGANLNIRYTDEETVIYTVINMFEPITFTTYLIENGIDINTQNSKGITPLMYAVQLGRNEIASLLIENKAEINATDKEGHTALYYAIRNNHAEMAKELLAHKATMSINGDKGKTLAQLARENSELTMLLQKYGYVPEPTKLWNGFTDQMTPAQVMARADKLLNAKGKNGSIGSFEAQFGAPLVFLENRNKNHKIVPDVILQYISPNKEFYRHESAGYVTNVVNVQFFFYKNKLYAIQINWNLSIKDSVIQKAKENYGNTYLTLHENTYYYSTGSSFHSEILFWEGDDRNIYLKTTKGTADELQLFVFSKENLQKYDADMAAKQENERRQAEEYRRKTSERIKF